MVVKECLSETREYRSKERTASGPVVILLLPSGPGLNYGFVISPVRVLRFYTILILGWPVGFSACIIYRKSPWATRFSFIVFIKRRNPGPVLTRLLYT